MRRACMIACLALAAAGCRHTNTSVELLESELRWMEDQLYLLDEQLDQTQAQLESSRRSNASLRNMLAAQQNAGSSAGAASSSAPEAPSDQGVGGQSRPSSGQEVPGVDEGELRPPTIELGPERGGTPGGGVRPRLEDGLGWRQAPATYAPFTVASIELNDRLTGGYDFDRHPGDDGLMVVVEPRDVDGHFVGAPGQLSLQLRDPRKSGPQSLVARWDFDEADARTHLRQTLLGKGYHFELPWPGAPPAQRELQLVASFRPLGAEPLTAEKRIEIELPTSGAGDDGSVVPATASALAPSAGHAVPPSPSLLPDVARGPW